MLINSADVTGLVSFGPGASVPVSQDGRCFCQTRAACETCLVVSMRMLKYVLLHKLPQGSSTFVPCRMNAMTRTGRAVQAHRERHDAGACGRHEGFRDLEQPPAAPTQLLPLLAAKLGVEALCYVSRQLYVLLLVGAWTGKPAS